MVCPRCGLWNPQRNATCESCGEPLRVNDIARSSDPQLRLPLADSSAIAAAFPAGLPGMAAPPAPEPQIVQTAPSQPRARVDEASVYAPVLGPVDRESFFAAQRRHRRATWKLTAGSAVAAVVTGVPLSFVLTPIVFAVILILTRLVHIVVPVPDVVWDTYRNTGLVLAEAIEAMDDPSTPGVEEGDIGRVPISLLLKAAGVWLLPGILLMLAIWPVLIRLFQHGGAGGVLLSLGAREPIMTDLEERQLVNVVEEMAIAAGIQPPKVMLIDSEVANAAAVGSSPEDATIVVSRSLLDDLDRDETQGVLAHLVASVGNGDLRGAMSIIAIFQTFGFASALVKVPISRPARTTVRRMLGYVFSRHKPHERAAEANIISEMLTSGIWDTNEDDFDWLNERHDEVVERPGPSVRLLLYFPITFLLVFMATLLLEFPDALRRLSLFGVFVLAGLIVWYQREYVAYIVPRALKMARMIVMLPYYMAATLPQIMITMMTGYMLEPMLAWLWRTRRYLADATAVQLTRQPDWIVKGLNGIANRGGIFPGGKWAGPLFITGPRYGSGFTSIGGGASGFHPPIWKRVQKLQRLGATAPDVRQAPKRPRMQAREGAWGHPLARFFIGPLVFLLLAVVAILSLVALVLLAALSLFASMILMILVYGLFALLAPM